MWAKFTLYLLFTSFAIILQSGDGARILSVAFMSTKSHKITYEPLLEALAARGHNVTVVSPIPAKKTVKNMREILTIDVDKSMSTMPNMFQAKEKGENLDPFAIFAMVVGLCRDSLALPQLQTLREEKFDLIFLPAGLNDCAAAYVTTFNASIILLSPISVPSAVSSIYGNPSPASFVPNVFTGFSHKMTFYQRTVNLLVEAFFRSVMDFYYKPSVEATYRDILGSHLPSADELMKSTSLILSNSHFSIASVRPFLPDIIEVGGMHCRPASPLPKDLEDFVSSSGSDGFILFSMGSTLKASDMPEAKRKSLLAVFSKLKQKVLWKWETEGMADLPRNVKLSKWLPQQDVLGHSKIRAFITHGGYGSTTEAVYHGVPLVGLPMFGDQTMNMDASERAGFAVTLDFNTFSEESLLEAINKVLYDARYQESVTSLSKVFQDQPEHPLDRAVFWSEYVIRHKGAPHLRSSARDLNFFQYHSIDVIALLLGSLSVIIWVGIKLAKLCCRVVCALCKSKSTESKLKKNK